MNPMEIYEKKFKEILELRRGRAKIYGDEWFYNPIKSKIWLLWEKAQRSAYIVENNIDLKNNYESLEDTLKDSINYALFALVILERIKNEKK